MLSLLKTKLRSVGLIKELSVHPVAISFWRSGRPMYSRRNQKFVKMCLMHLSALKNWNNLPYTSRFCLIGGCHTPYPLEFHPLVDSWVSCCMRGLRCDWKCKKIDIFLSASHLTQTELSSRGLNDWKNILSKLSNHSNESSLILCFVIR